MEITILDDLNETYLDKWQEQFIVPDRAVSEGLWRRTQEIGTDDIISVSENDRRRRMIHYYDKYDVIKTDTGCKLVIVDLYLWLCTTLPKEEMSRYLERIKKTLEKSCWVKVSDTSYRKDGITISFELSDKHPEDKKKERNFPDNYQTAEFLIQSHPGFKPDKDSPWDVLNSGIREKGIRVSEPNVVVDLRELKKYAPFQFELGGGASIELGIPPLNHLHTVYQVSDTETKAFIFGDHDNLLVEILSDLENFYKNKASIAYRKSFLAEPDQFYHMLSDLYERGIIVGDVITNNFDGITSLVGLKEKYVRKYEDTNIIPKIEFSEDAKALIVVGSHADRRLIQKSARQRGLKVIYVDPEKYVDYKNNPIEYPLETIEDSDFLVHMSASEFAISMNEVFKRDPS